MTIPTLVIGIGMGGIRVVQTFADVVNEAKQRDFYEFIAIDSNRKDLDDVIRAGQGIQTVPIDETGYAIREMIQKADYLYDGVAPTGGGAIRDRIYARFLFDLNSGKVNSAIEASMVKLRGKWQQRRETQNQRVLIWVVHTLGGGTGSGAFPSLIAKVKELADGVLAEHHITPIIWCIGILPSATNINDISTAKFDKKYTANSYAALSEIQKLSAPENLTIPTFNTYPKKEIAILKRPFDRYFLFGVDEDAIVRLRDGKSDEAEEYLDDVNRQIAFMMYYLPHYPGGIENLWHNMRSQPFIVFGESEITVPLAEMQQYAKENDALGKIPDAEKKKDLEKRAEMLVQLPTDDLNETRIENECLSVVGSERLRSLGYFIGQVQHEFDKEFARVETSFNDEIQVLWEKLKCKDWAYNKIKNYDDENTESKYQRIVQVVEERIEDNKKFIASLMNAPLFIQKKERKEQNIKNGILLNDLRNHYDRFIKVRRLKLFIDGQIGKKLEQYTGAKETGAGNISHQIRKRVNELNIFGDHLCDSGVGRVIKLGVPDKKVDQLTLSNPDGINISKLTSMPEFLEILGIEDAKAENLFRNRIDLASNYTVQVAVGLGTNQVNRLPSEKELHVFYRKENEPVLAKFSNLLNAWKLERVPVDSINPENIAFIPFQIGIEIGDTKDFTYREKEYQNGDLAKIIGMENIGIIFAHPEWFPKDENVRRAFPEK